MQQNCPATTLVLLADLAYNLHFGGWLALTVSTTLFLLAIAFLPLHILLPLGHLLDLLLDLPILILVSAAGQFILEVHWCCCNFLLYIQMGNSSAKLLLIGLDNAGKSTILARIM